MTKHWLSGVALVRPAEVQVQAAPDTTVGADRGNACVSDRRERSSGHQAIPKADGGPSVSCL